MEESFGARLRRRREAQGVALDAIARQTKIKGSLLQELERDDVAHWPSGIFRRSFIRSYAQAIGLDPDAVVREFNEVHPDPADLVAPTAPVAGPEEGGPPSRLREMLGSAWGSLFRTRRPPAIEPLRIDAAPVVPAPVASAPMEPDLPALARLCTDLGRADQPDQIRPLLNEAARVLHAIGLIVWIWEPRASELRPALAYGYSDKVLANLPAVRREADNATAAAFRTEEARTICSSGHARGALAVPMLTSAGCAGVLAAELHAGAEESAGTRAAASILAAVLAQVIGSSRVVELEPAECQSMA